MMLNQPPVIIDEVQRAPEFFRYIKPLCDETEERGLFCLSESQQFRLMQNISETLSGRISIVELSAVQDLDAFRRFMIAAAARTGEILNYSSMASEVGKDVATVKKWISILEASGIIYLLEPYGANVLKRAIRTPKLYFQDKKRTKRNGETVETEQEIDLIIEENGVLYPIEIKQSSRGTADETSAFLVLDQLEDKKRGTGAVICMCPQPGALGENVLQVPVWYI